MAVIEGHFDHIDLTVAVLHGMECTWWDSVDKAVNDEIIGYRCPFCNGPTNMSESAEALIFMAAEMEARGHIGLVNRIQWMRGRCYKTDAEAKAAYDVRGQ